MWVSFQSSAFTHILHTQTRSNRPAHTHTCTHANKHAHTQTRVHTHRHAYIHMHTHIGTLTPRHAHTHTHTYKHQYLFQSSEMYAVVLGQVREVGQLWPKCFHSDRGRAAHSNILILHYRDLCRVQSPPPMGSHPIGKP